MPCFRSFIVASVAVLGLLPSAASAQSPGGTTQDPALAAPRLPSAGTPAAKTVDAPKNTTPPQPDAPQPALPSAEQASPPKPSSSVVEEEIRKQAQPRVAGAAPARRTARRAEAPRRRHAGRRYHVAPLDRPALAGVELVAPLAPPGEGPHVTVPTPAYPIESVVARITTPLPPIRCRPTRRDPYAPDPHLYEEVPVQCEPDED